MPEVPVLSNEQKNDFANKARDRLREEIYASHGFSSEDARLLGSLYLAYHTEVFLHIEDMSHGESEIYREGIHERRIELEAILFAAQSGDYIPLKKELLRQGKKLKKKRNDSWFGWYGKGLEQLATSIKDTDTPFKPPLPAWASVTEEVA